MVVEIAPRMVASETRIAVGTDGSIRVCFDPPDAAARHIGHFADCRTGRATDAEMAALRQALLAPFLRRSHELAFPVADGAVVLVQMEDAGGARTVRMQPYLEGKDPAFDTVVDVAQTAWQRIFPPG